MARPLRSFVLALALVLTAQRTYAAAAILPAQIEAARCCREHCKRPLSMTAAGQCCSVAPQAADPSLASTSQGLESAPALHPALAAPAVAASVPRIVVRAFEPHATGPPTYLRVLSLRL